MKKRVLCVLLILFCISCRQAPDILSEFLGDISYQLLNHYQNKQHQGNDFYEIKIDQHQKKALLAQMDRAYADDEVLFKTQINEKFRVKLSDDYHLYVKEFKIKNSYCATSLCAVYVLSSPQHAPVYIEFFKF